MKDGEGWAVLLQQCHPNSAGSLVIARMSEIPIVLLFPVCCWLPPKLGETAKVYTVDRQVLYGNFFSHFLKLPNLELTQTLRVLNSRVQEIAVVCGIFYHFDNVKRILTSEYFIILTGTLLLHI